VIAKRLSAIDTQIAAIQKRLSALERPPTTAKAIRNTEVRGDGWRTIRNWDRVKTGMSFAQVTQILGKPTKIDGSMYGSNNPNYYYEGKMVSGEPATGYIEFRQRRVKEVHKPVL
jgi:outer membrane protein assembly factor BamE (lipoprotein component of BamABCDE complex)